MNITSDRESEIVTQMHISITRFSGAFSAYRRSERRNRFAHTIFGTIFTGLVFSFFALPASGENKWIAQRISGDAMHAKWCGSHRVVWDGGERGIYLYDRITDTERIIKKLISPSWYHTNPFCSPDGRYVLYADVSSGAIKGKVHAFDTDSNKTATVDCITKDIFLSPDLQTAATTTRLPSNCGVIRAPWNKDISILKLSNVDRSGFHPPSIWKWFPDNHRVVLGYVGIGDPLVVQTRKGPEPGTRTSFSIYDFTKKELIFVESLPRNTSPPFLFLDGGRVMYFHGKEEPGGDYLLYRLDTTTTTLRPQKLGLRNVRVSDVHPRWGLLYMAGIYKGLGQNLWLASLKAKDPGESISNLLWMNVEGFSNSGDAILATRRDIDKLPENEMTRIPHSLYILTPNKR